MFTCLWVSAVVFAISILLSYSNTLDVDGSLRMGFPFEFYDRSAAMSGPSNESGIFANFRIYKLLMDIAAAIFLGIALVGIRSRFRKSKSSL